MHVIGGLCLQQHCGLTIQGRKYLVLFEAINHCRDIHDADLTAIRRLPDHDLLKVSLGVGEILGSQLYIARLRPDFAY